MKRRDFLAQTGATAALAAVGQAAAAKDKGGSQPAASSGPSAIVVWNRALTAAVAYSYSPPTVAARALSMVYEAAYNAWAAYESRASFTLTGLRSRPAAESKDANKTIAIGHAIYGVLGNLFPASVASFDLTLAQTLAGLPVTMPEGLAARQLGTAAAVALLQSRQGDGSNQYGEFGGSSYADYTGYVPVNSPTELKDPLRWQPLLVGLPGAQSVQQFVTPHWGQVRPFAIASGATLRPSYSPYGPTQAEMSELIALSAGLNDVSKVHVDFFANNPGSVTPPGQWSQFAEIVSAVDGNSLDEDVVLFFVLGQAMLDASIACWEAKRYYDSVRPLTSIRLYYRGQTIRSWGGPGLGTQTILGENWQPYQRSTSPSPAFPEFISGHSTFSAAAATCMAALRGSDAISLKFAFPAGGVKLDIGVPAAPVTLQWDSLSAAADAAGYSRRLGGIHFEQGDVKGRALGKQVGKTVLRKCQTLVRNG